MDVQVFLLYTDLDYSMYIIKNYIVQTYDAVFSFVSNIYADSQSSGINVYPHQNRGGVLSPLRMLQHFFIIFLIFIFYHSHSA